LRDLYGLGVNLRTSDPPSNAVKRLPRHSTEIRHSVSATDWSGGRERMPNDDAVNPPRMARWREVLFRLLLRADAGSNAPYGIPPEQVHDVDVVIER
jgi:hypothetical protein